MLVLPLGKPLETLPSSSYDLHLYSFRLWVWFVPVIDLGSFFVNVVVVLKTTIKVDKPHSHAHTFAIVEDRQRMERRGDGQFYPSNSLR
jgi:hypothetical protein